MESLYDLIAFVKSHAIGTSMVVDFIVLVIIEKSKSIKFNPLTQLGIFLGNWLKPGIMLDVEKKNGVVIDRIEELETSIKEINRGCQMHSQGCHQWIKSEIATVNDTFVNGLEKLKNEMVFQVESSKMENYRHLMFRFEEGLLQGATYTKDHWDSMNNISKRYIDFCNKEKRFINSECEGAIKLIQETWATRPWEKKED